MTKISNISEIQDANGDWTKEGNFVIPASDNSSAVCYHIFKDENGKLYQHNHEDSGYETKDVDGDNKGYDADLGKYLLEDRQCYYIPFNQLFTGYGWGSSPVHAADTYENIDVRITDNNSNLKSQIKFESTGVTGVGENDVVYIGDLFKAATGVDISTTTVQVFVSPVGDGSTVAAVSDSNTDWTKGTLTFSGTGSAKVVITDYFYCLDTVLNITVGGQVTAIDKFEVKNSSAVAGSTVTLDELFSAKADVVIENVSVVVNGGTYTHNEDDWTQGTITFSEVGTATVTISATGSTETINNVTVTEIDAFTTVFENTDKYLYRVGNLNSITLSWLFKQLESATINGDVTVTAVSKHSGETVLTATFAKGSWLNGTIDFADDFTGVVAVTVDALGANPYTLNLEVVDAVNATSATSATENNVVLLNDIGSGFTVSGRYTVFGNGFTLNYTGNGQYLNNGLAQGIVTVADNGRLDNLRIVASIYPSAFMYYGSTVMGDYVQQSTNPTDVEGEKTRYYYQLSAVAASGSATISNCYIYGARNNIYVSTGNVTIEDSVLVNILSP